MIIIIRLFLSLVLPLLLGYSVISLIARNEVKIGMLERSGLAWALGIGLLGIEMFIVSLLGIPVNLYTVALPLLILLVAAVAYLLTKRIPLMTFDLGFKRDKDRWRNIIEIALIILIALTVAYVFFDALVKPIVNFDDLWRQGAIAKIIFSTGKVITGQSSELAGPHPYLNPLSQAWIYLGIGEWNDALGKVVFPICFISLLLIFFSALRRSVPLLYALLFTYFLASFPLMVFHAGSAYSDLMQTFYYSAGILWLFSWMQEKKAHYLYFSALLLGIGIFVKQVGFPLWGAAATALFIYLFAEKKKEFGPGFIFLGASILVALPWLFSPRSFLMARLSSIAGDAPLVQNLAYGSPTVSGILYHLARRLFTYADWQILWFVLILCLVFFWKRIWGSNLKYLLLIVIFDFLLVIYAFYSDPMAYQFLVDGTLVNRMMMYQVPVALYLAALALSPAKE